MLLEKLRQFLPSATENFWYLILAQYVGRGYPAPQPTRVFEGVISFHSWFWGRAQARIEFGKIWMQRKPSGDTYNNDRLTAFDPGQPG